MHLLIFSKASHLMFFNIAHAINGEKQGMAWMYYTTHTFLRKRISPTNQQKINYHNHIPHKTTDFFYWHTIANVISSPQR